MRIAIVVSLLALGFIAGCASEGKRVPADIEAVRTHDFNPTDLQLISRNAVNELFEKIQAQQVFAGEKPVLYVSNMRNLTDEHIDTNMVGEYVATMISDSGKVRLVDPTKAQEEAIHQLEFQQGVFTDPSTAQKIGKMLGAEYFVQGELSNIVAKSGWRKGQYFLYTLTLIRIETLEAWKSNVEIQKVSRRGLFGW